MHSWCISTEINQNLPVTRRCFSKRWRAPIAKGGNDPASRQLILAEARQTWLSPTIAGSQWGFRWWRQRAYHPHQRFRDSFKIAGDDILLDVIQSYLLPALNCRCVKRVYILSTR
jgi:hypothetical protein